MLQCIVKQDQQDLPRTSGIAPDWAFIGLHDKLNVAFLSQYSHLTFHIDQHISKRNRACVQLQAIGIQA